MRLRFPGVPGNDVWSRLGVMVVALGLLLAIFGRLLAPYDAGRLVGIPYAPPSMEAWLGTDSLGRDVLSRLLYGAQYSIGIALAATVLGFLIGLLIGLSSAELRGLADSVLMWIVDIMLSFPPLLAALIIISALGQDLVVLVVALALVQAPRVARVSRGLALNVASLQFVEVARARGESLMSILVREILPNTKRGLAVEFALRLTFSILLLSALSFLGLGIQPPFTDWGGMLRENITAMTLGNYAPILAPALAIGAMTIAVSLIVDWLGSLSGRAIPDEIRS